MYPQNRQVLPSCHCCERWISWILTPSRYQTTPRLDARTFPNLKHATERLAVCPLSMYVPTHRINHVHLPWLTWQSRLRHRQLWFVLASLKIPSHIRRDCHPSESSFIFLSIEASPNQTFLSNAGSTRALSSISPTSSLRYLRTRYREVPTLGSLDLPRGSSQSDGSFSTRIQADNRPRLPPIPHRPSRIADPSPPILVGLRSHDPPRRPPSVERSSFHLFILSFAPV